MADSLTGKSASYRSGTIKERTKELNNLIRNPDVRCIMSTIEGMNSNSLLPYIDYDVLVRDPKILIGIQKLGRTRSRQTAKGQSVDFCLSRQARGRVIGGNLNSLQGFWGSKYKPTVQTGDILFDEDSMKNPGTLERSFSLLKVNGVLDKVSGIILGKHELFDDKDTGLKPFEILQEALNGHTLPLLAEFDCSHTHPMSTLPIKVEIELDATHKTVSILSEWVQA